MLEQHDLTGYAPGALAAKGVRGSTRLGTCDSSAGNEGGWVSRARLRGGGTITKAMRHGDLTLTLTPTLTLTLTVTLTLTRMCSWTRGVT